MSVAHVTETELMNIKNIFKMQGGGTLQMSAKSVDFVNCYKGVLLVLAEKKCTSLHVRVGVEGIQLDMVFEWHLSNKSSFGKQI